MITKIMDCTLTLMRSCADVGAGGRCVMCLTRQITMCNLRISPYLMMSKLIFKEFFNFNECSLEKVYVSHFWLSAVEVVRTTKTTYHQLKWTYRWRNDKMLISVPPLDFAPPQISNIVVFLGCVRLQCSRTRHFSSSLTASINIVLFL